MKKFYVTFGVNSPNASKYVVVHAEDVAETRVFMYKEFGWAWSFIYTEAEFERMRLTHTYTTLKEIGHVPQAPKFEVRYLDKDNNVLHGSLITDDLEAGALAYKMAIACVEVNRDLLPEGTVSVSYLTNDVQTSLHIASWLKS